MLLRPPQSPPLQGGLLSAAPDWGLSSERSSHGAGMAAEVVGDPLIGDVPKGEPPIGDFPIGDLPKGEPPIVRPSIGDVPKGETGSPAISTSTVYNLRQWRAFQYQSRTLLKPVKW